MCIPNIVLEHHSTVIRDGRILDILPIESARMRYSPSVVLQRSAHLLTPGLINSRARGATDHPDSPISLRLPAMLRAGITCFADQHGVANETAQAAAKQGIRAVVGLPIADGAQSLTQALSLRDEYSGHPLVSTAFAPQIANELSDATLSKLVTVADELDAGIMLDLQASAAEVNQSLKKYGVRPLERLWNLGLLSPALNACHMVEVTEDDIALAHRTGISISLCLQGGLQRGNGLAPVAAFIAAGIRLGLGSAGYAAWSQDIWGELRLAALLSSATESLQAATCGGAAVLGLDSEIGTLETGKWADLCCLDLSGPAMQPLSDSVAQVAFNGGRELVSDVWVAGRQLLSGGELTRAVNS
jgi:5-methylthioadenosine/S-adenosylhomocysteine deaminase